LDLKHTIDYIHQVAPELPVILDAKRGDIGNTNEAYAAYAFDYLGADAITVHPYLGAEALEPFLVRQGKGIFVLCRTSNPGAGEFQDINSLETGAPLFEVIASNVADKWDSIATCGLVVGATYPDELIRVRSIVGNRPILIPGIGSQGGDLETAVRNGRSSSGGGVFLNAARSVLFGSANADFADAARTEASRLDAAIRKVR
jgi:orotidine-5'-phosphate decarboxylase